MDVQRASLFAPPTSEVGVRAPYGNPSRREQQHAMKAEQRAQRINVDAQAKEVQTSPARELPHLKGPSDSPPSAQRGAQQVLPPLLPPTLLPLHDLSKPLVTKPPFEAGPRPWGTPRTSRHIRLEAARAARCDAVSALGGANEERDVYSQRIQVQRGRFGWVEQPLPAMSEFNASKPLANAEPAGRRRGAPWG